MAHSEEEIEGCYYHAAHAEEGGDEGEGMKEIRELERCSSKIAVKEYCERRGIPAYLTTNQRILTKGRK